MRQVPLGRQVLPAMRTFWFCLLFQPESVPGPAYHGLREISRMQLTLRYDPVICIRGAVPLPPKARKRPAWRNSMQSPGI